MTYGNMKSVRTSTRGASVKKQKSTKKKKGKKPK